MHTTKAPFLEDLCLLLIFRDAHLENLKENLMRLYDPCVAKVYVCVSKKLNFLTRVRVLREIRNVFTEADIFINNVTDAQLKLVAFYSNLLHRERTMRIHQRAIVEQVLKGGTFRCTPTRQ